MNTRATFIILLLANSLLAAYAYAEPQQTTATLNIEAKAKIKLFATELKTTLQQGIQQSGTEGSIEICNIHAPSIAASNSTGGWKIARTSLQYRNPKNKPDAWELSVLESFAQRKANGEPIANLETSLRTDTEFRFVKAIPTGGVCLACHGTDIDNLVSAKLHSLYPDDLAIGFKPGDIRGAFTLRKDL